MKKVLLVSGSITNEDKYGRESGDRAANALLRKGHTVNIIHAGDSARLFRELASNKYDVVVPIGFGPPCEDGHVYAMTRYLGTPCAGPTPAAGSVMLDKAILAKVAEGLFIHDPTVTVPNEAVFVSGDSDARIIECAAKLKTPLIVKPAFSGSSEGLTIVDNVNAIVTAVTNLLPAEGKVVVQELVEDIENEISVGVLDRATGPFTLPVVELARGDARIMGPEEKFGETSMERHIIPATISPELNDKANEVALRLHHSVGAVGLSRTDMLITSTGKIVILETNGIPGLLDCSIACDAAAAAGIRFDDLIEAYMESAFFPRPEPDVWEKGDVAA